ncbi:MAG: acetyl-CoA C-acetyltransferase [Candidatus Alcyoniella australis]|nr:acetyl-CoA C-acetyltransferase [Candidatus Alcyoniella australis]
MRDVVIVNGARTAVGTFGGSLKGVKVTDLGTLVIKEALKRSGLKPALTDTLKGFRPDVFGDFEKTEHQAKFFDYDQGAQPVYVDEVIMGNVLQAGQGQNTGRQAMIRAGLPEETSAITVNKVCASGMKAIAIGAQSIACGDADVIIAGGMENMSQVPYALPKARWGYRMDMPNGELTDLMVFDGLYEIFYGYHMGLTAENIAESYGITRLEQDELGAMSHQRARAAISEGRVAAEIVPVVMPQRRGDPIVFEIDERPMDTTVEKMGKLRTVFKKDGTVTAGNASGINDASAAVLLMSADKASELGLEPLAKVKAWASGGVDPAYMGLGPIPATRKLMHKIGAQIGDFDLIELNEAFASQAIACIRELGVDMDKTNLNGSGISIGHPIGCTGARIVYTLAMQLKAADKNLGLASLCIGGGQGMSMVLER